MANTFDLYEIEYNGKMFPVADIEGYKIDSECPKTDYLGMPIMYSVSTERLNSELKSGLDCGDKEAEEIDNEIFFYCDNGFLEGNPSEEDVIKYFKNLNL